MASYSNFLNELVLLFELVLRKCILYLLGRMIWIYIYIYIRICISIYIYVDKYIYIYSFSYMAVADNVHHGSYERALSSSAPPSGQRNLPGSCTKGDARDMRRSGLLAAACFAQPAKVDLKRL